MLGNTPNETLTLISLGTVLFSGWGLVWAIQYWRRSSEWVPLISVPATLYVFVLHLITAYNEVAHGVLPSLRLAYRAAPFLLVFSNVVIFWVRLASRRKG